MKKYLLVALVALVGCNTGSVSSSRMGVYGEEDNDFYTYLAPLLKEPNALISSRNFSEDADQKAQWDFVLGKTKTIDIVGVTSVGGKTWYAVKLGMKNGTIFKGTVYYGPKQGSYDIRIYETK